MRLGHPSIPSFGYLNTDVAIYRSGISFSPLDLSPSLWLDGMDSSTILNALALPASNGEQVATWIDKSGNGNHMTQVTSSLRPLKSAMGGVDFDGIDDILSIGNSLFTGADARTIVTVYLPVSGFSSSNPICGQAGANGLGQWFILQFRNDIVTGDPYLAQFAADLTNGQVPDATAKIAAATYDGTTSKLYKNGTLVDEGDFVLNTNNSDFVIGRTENAEFANMNFKNCIVFDRCITDIEMTQLTDYLVNKYSIITA